MHQRRRAQQGWQLGAREQRLAKRFQGHVLKRIRQVTNPRAEEVPPAAGEQHVPLDEKMVERPRQGGRGWPLDAPDRFQPGPTTAGPTRRVVADPGAIRLFLALHGGGEVGEGVGQAGATDGQPGRRLQRKEEDAGLATGPRT